MHMPDPTAFGGARPRGAAAPYPSGGGGGGGGFHSTSSNTSPAVEQALSSLKTVLNMAETSRLRELCESDTQQSALLTDVDQLKAIGEEKNLLEIQIKSLAEYNVTRKEPFRQAQHSLAAQFKAYADKLQQFEKNKLSLQSSRPSSTPESALNILKVAMSKSEEESDALADRLLENDIDIESFVKQFIELRTLYHQRRVNVEKMSELIVRSRAPPAQSPF